ncbi:hypothetical protein [Spirosoma oryzicola]|uniref:hypothetical protein n=1 Tax=Spirosoma oryzicola TaxID=2898794 RepID=UPI001E2B32B9|nr:hypothetical protein [Spirosoma oryzicola]UHG93282.1 hypothetical protein LQ777_10355 [Spirosoma oryzicola]
MNLGIAGIAPVALALTLANGKRFKNYGFLQAARSPQLAALIAELNPQTARADGRYSSVKENGKPKAVVKLNYRPQINATPLTERTVTTGAGPVEDQSIDVPFNVHRELPLTYETTDIIRLAKETEEYLKRANANQFAVSLSDFKMLSDMGDQILRRTDAVLASVNTAVGTAMLAGAGGNLMIGSTSPANMAVQPITAFKSDGSLSLDPFDFFAELKQTHHFEGKPIVIGAKKFAKWLRRKGIATAADLGYDYAAAFAELDIEGYFDEDADTILGPDEILIIDPGAACMETILEHRLYDQGGVIPGNKVANTTYGTASFNIAQTNAETFQMDIDMRVREEDTAYPRFTITPSMHFGVFTRPAGYHKNYGGWETHTGIFRAKLVQAS